MNIGRAGWLRLLAGRSTVVRVHDSVRAIESCSDAVFDAVLADPPYSSGGLHRSDRIAPVLSKYGTESRGAVAWSGDARDQLSWTWWCERWLGEALRVTKTGGLCLVFADWRQVPALATALQAGGWVWRGMISWDKGEGGARPVEGGYRQQCEYILWATSGPREGADGVYEPGVYHCATERDRQHVCQKPVALLRRLLRPVPRGGRVLDPFAGGGSVSVACALDGLVGIGLERDRVHVETGLARLGDATAAARSVEVANDAGPLFVRAARAREGA